MHTSTIRHPNNSVRITENSREGSSNMLALSNSVGVSRALRVKPRSTRTSRLRTSVKVLSLKTGIVGLPNVGKSTLFNALVENGSAQAANYPFCTIEPNIGIVPVPDERLSKLAQISKSTNEISHCHRIC